MAPPAENAEEWLQAMKELAEGTSKNAQLPPPPDMTGASRNEKAVLLFMRGIAAAELGDMNTAETMVRYALKVSPELSAPMSQWPNWAKDITRRMIETQLGGKLPERQKLTQPQDQATATSNLQEQEKSDRADTTIDASSSILPTGLIFACILIGVVGTLWIRSGRQSSFSRAYK
eukprot:TRINITY_DN70270_c0_g1_i1.p1 TRINITY_DN70270_c0_g1~~TRINITY_DN70270_c0_g1_i1.p1  ORF type:complete len:175 (-),score=47.98 TRINITY_DN70270_c0_g1_i1:35-559(-)